MEYQPQRVSLVVQTAEVISQQIVAGRWHQNLPGEKELCAELGVSRGTLRLALAKLERSGWLRTSPGRRRELVPLPAKARPDTPPAVMLVTPLHLWELPRDLVFILDYLRQYLEGAGYHLIEHHLCGRNGQHGETWHPDPILEEMAKANSVPAAWILIRPQASVQRWFSERDLPALIIGSRFPGMNLASVDMDHRVSCQHAINLFLAQGHQRIVLLSPKDGLARDLLAEQVFLETIVAEEVELKVGRYDGTKGGLCCTLEALLDTLRLPLALLASRAQHALTTLTYLQSRGLSVPRQIAIISRNHDDYLACTIPEISRYMLPAEFVARKVFRMALHLVQSGERSDCLLIPEFVKGGTV